MLERSSIYQCDECKNQVTVLHAGEGKLSCCDKAMELLEERTADSSNEKHVPIIEKVSDGYKVIVGSTLHPMGTAHYIEWIELNVEGREYRQYLRPEDEPVAFFPVAHGSSVSSREFCNIHGLWKTEGES